MPKLCYLRDTDLVLADGKTYKFRAIPLSRETLPLLRRIMDDAVPEVEKLESVLAAVEISLSFDHEPEAVQEMIGNGLVKPTDKEVLNAMVAGLKL